MAESKTCQHRNRQRFTGANESYTCLDCGADLSLTDLGIKQRNIERLETELAAANERADKAIEDRTFVIACAQKYPTAEAYEAVCAARTKWQERAEKAEQSLASARQAAFAECIRLCRSHARRNGFGAGGALACVELIQNAQSLPPTHMFVPKEINREIHRNLLDVWNDCMLNAETLEMTWPKLVKALAAHGGGGE